MRFHISISPLLGLLLSLSLLMPTTAGAKLTGEAELGYVKYESRRDGNNFVEAHSFQQRYSLLYSSTGRLANGRLGGYSASLGYEWGSFDGKVKTLDPLTGLTTEVSPSISAGHVLYEGEVVIDPVELPLRFRAYSQDMRRISFGTDLLPSLSSDFLVRPGVTTNLYNGTHIASGATLLFGVKNGVTNGYNAIFRHIPMIMIDYRDELNRDLKSLTPTDTRLSRLAFVSLNKKDNWFHYRQTRYTDKINRDESWTENQFQLGTVDHLMARKWVALTNWIKISADGQFTKRHSEGARPDASFEAYDLNLFGIATRQSWEARSFVSFNRTVKDRELRYDETIPLYVSGVWGPETEWKARFSTRQKSNESLLTGFKRDESATGATLRIDTFKRSKFTLSNTLGVEYSDTQPTKNLAIDAGIETASTRRFSKEYDLAASYNLKNFSSDNVSTGETSYLVQTLMGRVAYAPYQKFRINLDETLTFASGTNPNAAANNLITVGSTLVPTSTDNFARRDSGLNNYTRSVTMLTATWTPAARFDVSLWVTEDILSKPGAPLDYLTIVKNTINYRMNQQVSIRIDNSFANSQPADTASYLGRGTFDYTPNRNMDAQLVYSYNRDSGPASTSTGIEAKQRFNYYFYKANGMVRRLLELNESLSYSEVDNSITSPIITKAITLGAKYYPLSRLFLAGNVQYTLSDPGSVDKYILNGSIGMNFKALQANLDYTYGKMVGGDNRIEKRLAANVKKVF